MILKNLAEMPELGQEDFGGHWKDIQKLPQIGCIYGLYIAIGYGDSISSPALTMVHKLFREYEIIWRE